MTAPEIQELDPQTVERIAAGEVVERPASVVKELLENSIDAGASRVTVAVENGGIDGIRVTDDGQGMTREQLERAVEKHTTSKIRDIDDLESGIGTLGFRGEALHAIGAVSRMTITSRPEDESQATKLTVEGGEMADSAPAGGPSGTTVEISDLFYNVPARRKYLKQESTEFAHVNTVTTNYALANPDVAVTLEHDGRETFATTGTGDLQEAVMSVYGREVAESMREIPDSDLPDGPLQSVSGLVSHPETNRASRDYLSTFVNGRYVTATAVRDAIVEAYDTQLAPDRYPFTVLFFDVDPATVDVNVHPRKLEVRFADEEGVRDQITTAVEEALLEEGLVRTSAPRGQSAPDETDIQPETTQQTIDDDETTHETSTGTASSEPTDSDHSDPPDDQQRAESESHERTEASSRRTRSESSTTDSEASESPNTEPESSPPNTEMSSTEARQSQTGRQSQDSDSTVATGQESSGSKRTSQQESTEKRRRFRESGQQQRLVEGDDEQHFDHLPAMRILGQYSETYVVAETDDGLLLIDQHAADERINYERLKESFSGETTTQALADPVTLDVTAQEAELFDAHSDSLSRLGFHASLVEDRTIEVRTVPTKVTESAGPELVRDVLGEFVRGADSAAETVEAAVDDLLADLACYPSITGNTALTEGSVVDLLSTLDECENPYACPHGRPVLVEFDTEEIEARFERDYPGHS
jgi:DNA mismatch repair protein MutL